MITLDELLERDKQREEDGFKRKIRIGRIVKPGSGEKDKIIVVPTTVEEKFVHDEPKLNQETGEGEPSSGTGDGEEGDIIGEQPVRPEEGDGEGEGEGSGEGPGEGQGGEHEFESSAYELGKVLSQDFQLPNLQNKGKKTGTFPVYLRPDRQASGYGPDSGQKSHIETDCTNQHCLGYDPGCL